MSRRTVEKRLLNRLPRAWWPQPCKSRDRGSSVTVCVVAACNNNTLIGASDRMLTAADVEFEPQQTKVVGISNSIAVMIAGDTSLQTEILMNVMFETNAAMQRSPETWLRVQDVAEAYRRHYHKARLRRSEDSILAPLGLNHDSFIGRQQEMSAQLVSQLTTELINFEIPSTETLFAGIDSTGFHIYMANHGKITCHDSIGFAAIGSGAWHANSQLMFSGHTRFKPLPETLLTVYSAKKRSDVAPGVGKATDMFIIGPQLGSYVPIGDHVLSELEKIYQSTVEQSNNAAEKARTEVNQYVEKIVGGTTAKEQEAISSDSDGDKAIDQKNTVPRIAEKEISAEQG